MKALVTGANGLVGANLVRELVARGVEVHALVRESSDLSALAALPLTLHRADVTRDRAALETAARGCTVLFHTAMHFTYDPHRRAELEAAALEGTENVLRAARAAGVRRAVVTSSSVVFGYGLEPHVRDESSPSPQPDGENAYIDAKIRQDALTLALGRDLGQEVVIVSPTLVVGPHAASLGPSNGLIVGYLSDPFRMTFPGGCNIVAAADVATGHWLAAQRGQPGERYILGAHNLEFRELHALVAELAGVEPPRMMLNHALAYLAATAEELQARFARRAPFSTRAQAAMVGRYYWYSHAKAERLGYRPRPARAALAEAISWLAMSRHVGREVRAALRLHDEVYAARRRGQATPRQSAA